ncbi:hypothetical protein VCRA2133E348_250068 [Vibrio crassostreae]|nr:hypothetical protein VCRA2119O48_220068 [Vibrio crassostreae]CAK2810883.1 hypothetical protein VCRA2133E348_250068 [Vibrio crassostreae]CAK3286031.1 hypothetical protein VCRA213O314_240027 [Vibrio crassostreae]CAK3850485.1 hypothetical protein VCRA212O16_230069 [Vibrio crassostreae]
MHRMIIGSGLVFLIVHHCIQPNELLNTFGWLGVGLGAALWWDNEKKTIAQLTNKNR